MSLIAELLSTAKISEGSTKDYQVDVDALLTEAEVASNNIFYALKSQYVHLEAEIDDTDSLQSDLNKCLENVNNLSAEINDEIIPSVEGSAIEVQKLTSRLKELKLKLEVTQSLFDIHSFLEDFTHALTDDEFLVAVESLNKVEEFLKNVATKPIESQLEILGALQDQLILDQQQLMMQIDDKWNRLLWFREEESGIDSHSVTSLFIFALSDAPDNDSENFRQMFLSLNHLGELKRHVRIFGKNILSSFIEPLLMENGQVEVRPPTNRGASCISIRRLVSNNLNRVTSPIIALNSLKTLFAFIQSCFEGFSLSGEEHGKSWFMEYLGNEIGSEFLELFLSACLEPSIPTDKKKLANFNEVQTKVEDFHKFLVQIGFCDDKNKTLVQFVSNLDSCYGHKFKSNFLSKARNLMTHSLDKTVLMNDRDSREMSSATQFEPIDVDCPTASSNYKFEAISSKAFQFPTCRVSESVCELLDLIYATLEEAFSSSPEFAKELFLAVRNALSMYCYVVPVAHSHTLSTTPEHPALLHNNSLLLSHHAMFLGSFCKGQLSESFSPYVTAVDLGHQVRSCGSEVFLEAMQRHRDSMIQRVKSGLELTSLKFNGSSVEPLHEAVRECTEDLHRLKKAWYNVLPEAVYEKSIGTLADSLVEELITTVMALEEISADDVSSLINVLGLVQTSVPSLFNDSLEEALTKVPSWQKLDELLLVLGANLLELGDRWADGKGPLALHFSPSELRNLIKAMFQNTERRAKVLSRIN